MLTNTAPFFTVIFARAAFAQRTPRMAVGGLILGFTGVVVMVSSQLGGGSLAHVALGTAIALAAAAGFAVGALLIAHTAARQPNLDMLGFTAVQYVVGVLVLVLLVPIYGHLGRTDWGSGSLWGPVAWVSLGSSAAGSICFNLALATDLGRARDRLAVPGAGRGRGRRGGAGKCSRRRRDRGHGGGDRRRRDRQPRATGGLAAPRGRYRCGALTAWRLRT